MFFFSYLTFFFKPQDDDLTGADGIEYKSAYEMGQSWRVGGAKACKPRPQLVEAEPLCAHDTQARHRAHRVCSVFYGRAFSRCRQLVDVDVYARWANVLSFIAVFKIVPFFCWSNILLERFS